MSASSVEIAGEAQTVSIRIGDHHLPCAPRRILGRIRNIDTILDEHAIAFIHVGNLK